MYSRMHQVKFVEGSLEKFEVIWSVLAHHIDSNFLKAIFHQCDKMSSVNNNLGYWRNVFNKILSVNNKMAHQKELAKK